MAQRVIAPSSEIRADGAQVERRLPSMGHAHSPTASMLAADKESVLPGLQLVASLFKRWTIGTLHWRDQS